MERSTHEQPVNIHPPDGGAIPLSPGEQTIASQQRWAGEAASKVATSRGAAGRICGRRRGRPLHVAFPAHLARMSGRVRL